MNSKSLLIKGARGFFGHSIIDHIFNNYKKNNIKKILLLSRGVDKVKIDKKMPSRQTKWFVYQILFCFKSLFSGIP